MNRESKSFAQVKRWLKPCFLKNNKWKTVRKLTWKKKKVHHSLSVFNHVRIWTIRWEERKNRVCITNKNKQPFSPYQFLQEDVDTLFCQTGCTSLNKFWEATVRWSLLCCTGEYGLKWRLSISKLLSIHKSWQTWTWIMNHLSIKKLISDCRLLQNSVDTWVGRILQNGA